MNRYEKLARELRLSLHEIPEPSMKEIQTKQRLMDFLRSETSLEVIDKGSWFYVKYSCPNANDTIAFRADFDAVTGADGKSRHLCGHDGHAAVLATFAKWVSDTRPDSNVILLFQPGEESGEGAKICRQLFDCESVDEIYAFHNIPGRKEGALLYRHGTFACASVGLEISLHGKPAHAAYPETGVNPADTIAELILYIKRKISKPHRGMVLSTVIGIDAGSDSYGVSAYEGTLRLTVRAEYAEEFSEILGDISAKVKELSEKADLIYDVKEHEAFPATENADDCVDHIALAAEKHNLYSEELEHPFRWSEDFGWYLQTKRGAFFGIGAGENWPELHTESYEFNDNIIASALAAFQAILDTPK